MDAMIFKLGLTIEATSLYLIMDDLAQSGLPLSAEAYQARWTGSAEALAASLDELVAHRVLSEAADGLYSLTPSQDWRPTAR